MEIKDSWFIEQGFFRYTIDSDRNGDGIFISTPKWINFMNAYFEKYPVYDWIRNHKFLTKKKHKPNDYSLITPEKLQAFYKEWKKK